MHRNALLVLSGKHSFHRSKRTLQVIQPWCRNKFSVCTPDRTLHPIIEEQIMCKNILFLYFYLFRNNFQKLRLRISAPEKRQQIFLRIVRHAFVCLPVHVDCQTWDHDQIPVDIDQFLFQTAVTPYNHSARYRQRPVKPRCHQHTAITFHIQFCVGIFYPHFRIFLDLKSRRIAVAGNDMKLPTLLLWNRKCNQCRMISCYDIFPARL